MAKKEGETGLDLAERAKSGEVEFTLIEESIRACMSSKGFKYFPKSWDKRLQSPNYVTFPLSISESDRRSEIGYGIAARSVAVEESSKKDLNNDYFSALNESQKASYSKLLFVSENNPTPECIVPLKASPGLDSAMRQAMKTRKRLKQDGSFGKIDQRWRKCMVESGFEASGLIDTLSSAEAFVFEARDANEGEAPYDQLLTRELLFAKADGACVRGDVEEINRLRRKYE